MRIPDVQKQMIEMAGDMDRKATAMAALAAAMTALAGEMTAMAGETRRLVAEMFRRPAQKRAAKVSRPMTPELAEELVQTSKRYPGMPQHHISTLCGVNPGRVSETLNGKRT
jgi:hypothetical protein